MSRCSEHALTLGASAPPIRQRIPTDGGGHAQPWAGTDETATILRGQGWATPDGLAGVGYPTTEFVGFDSTTAPWPTPTPGEAC
ncbi:MAG: hypothetical protein ACK56I_05530, partial [bacterium]